MLLMVFALFSIVKYDKVYIFVVASTMLDLRLLAFLRKDTTKIKIEPFTKFVDDFEIDYKFLGFVIDFEDLQKSQTKRSQTVYRLMMIFFEISDKPATKKGYVPCHVILYPFCASGLVMLLYI
jgi:hypothetical protein